MYSPVGSPRTAPFEFLANDTNVTLRHRLKTRSACHSSQEEPKIDPLVMAEVRYRLLR